MWTRRRLVVGWVLLIVWVVAVLVWATRPATDHVQTGVVEGVNTSIVVTCNAPFDGSPGPAEPIEPVELPRQLQHIPCEAQHRSNQISLLIDAVVALAAAAVLTMATRRHRSRPEHAATQPEPAPI